MKLIKSAKPRIDLTGQRFGHLTVIRFAGAKRSSSGKSVYYLWECECDCGNRPLVYGNNLRQGGTLSCGCMRGRYPRD